MKVIIQLSNFRNIFNVPELRNKLGFTLFVLAVYRLGAHIPLPGINTNVLYSLSGSHASSGILGYLDLFSGGAMRQFAIFALGIAPYISASIMMQILSVTMPSLEQLAKEGSYGQSIMNQYTRYAALILSFFQGFTIAMVIERSYPGLALVPGWGFRISTMVLLSVGTMFVMWMSEQINAHGIGNGSSMIIFAGIVSGLPTAMYRIMTSVQTADTDPLIAALLIGLTLAVVSIVVFLEKGERRIPVNYARRVVGNRVYGGQTSYIPFKLNPANVVPVIFSSAFLGTLMGLFNFLGNFSSQYSFLWVFKAISELLEYRMPLNFVLTVLLIVFFAYFYTALMFDPQKLSDNIRKQGGFIAGIRPGRKTAEFFEYLLNRVCFPGALYLATLAIAPRLLGMYIPFPVMFEGTSMLIVVGVAIDLSAQVESALIERRYEGFLPTGRLRTRADR